MNPYVSNDIDKLRDAQRAVDRLPDGPDKDTLTFAVLQWMRVAFLDHRPLTTDERAWVKGVVARINNERGFGN